MSRVIVIRYAFPTVELAIVLLAALGLDAVVRGGVTRRRVAVVTGVTWALILAAALRARSVAESAGVATGGRPYLVLAVAWAAVAVAAAGAVMRDDRRRVALVGLVAWSTRSCSSPCRSSAPRSVEVD